jgi:hypothetical protein
MPRSSSEGILRDEMGISMSHARSTRSTSAGVPARGSGIIEGFLHDGHLGINDPD